MYGSNGFWVQHHDCQRDGFKVATEGEAKFWASLPCYTAQCRATTFHVIV